MSDEVLLIGFWAMLKMTTWPWVMIKMDMMTMEIIRKMTPLVLIWVPGWVCVLQISLTAPQSHNSHWILPKTSNTHSQVVTLKYGPKAYQKHLIPLCRAALIRGQPFEETSFMVGKYITNLPWPNFPTTSGNGGTCSPSWPLRRSEK